MPRYGRLSVEEPTLEGRPTHLISPVWSHRGIPWEPGVEELEIRASWAHPVTVHVVDTLTGEHRLTRVDILHDCGKSLNPALDLGQVEGGFVQGAGWLTSEEVCWDNQGHLRTHAPSTYKIPSCGDIPEVFNVKLWDKGRNREKTIHRSKAVGEPPFMLAISVHSAINQVIAGKLGTDTLPPLNTPASPEAILNCLYTPLD